MTIGHMITRLLRRAGFIKRPLDAQFNRHGILKPGLQANVHVVDRDGLIKLAARHPYNQNMTAMNNKDKNFPEFLQLEPYQSTYFIICDDDGRIIASATLRPEQNRVSEMMISQISIHGDYRNQGYATRLLREILQYLNVARPEVTRLSISRFMPMGHKYLRQKFIELAHEFKAETFEIYQDSFWDRFMKRLSQF